MPFIQRIIGVGKMSLSDEEADKLWLEMFEKEKVKRGLLFATELYQPVHIRCRLKEAKKEFTDSEEEITEHKYGNYVDHYRKYYEIREYGGDLFLGESYKDAIDAWFKKWFGSADK